jgi:hypothetical protein
MSEMYDLIVMVVDPAGLPVPVAWRPAEKQWP